MLKELNEHNEVNKDLKQNIFSLIGINRLFLPKKRYMAAVRWDSLQLETVDINNYITGSEIDLYFSSNTIYGETVMQEPSTNANGKVTTFISPTNGVYNVHCYVRISIAFTNTPASEGANYDATLYLYKNGVKYSSVDLEKLIINLVANPPNVQQTKFDILLVDKVSLQAGDKIYFTTKWSQAFFLTVNLGSYEVYGHFGVSLSNIEYKQINAASTAVYPV